MTSVLLAAAILWPAALTVLWLLRPVRERAPVLAVSLAWPALLLAITGAGETELIVPGVFTGVVLGVDELGRPFLLLSALLWSVVGIAAHGGLRDDERRNAFTGFMLAAGTGNLGLTLAQDVLSFYLFFALMTFAAYGLVVHTRSSAARRAGRVYIVMALFGEMLLLAGLLRLLGAAPDATFSGIMSAWHEPARPEPVALLLLLGFGVKVGLVPLHMWLPLAHPVAPTPASALLSGAMIKAGVLGWLRTLPVGTLELPAAGMTALILGTAATILAAIAGVMQREPKVVLAYSSVSQMGFLAAGTGAALWLPAAAPALMLAVAVYAVHHALAKAALFLAAGVVHGRNWKLLVTSLPALVLAGAPLTSGAIAKSALKAGLAPLPGAWLTAVDVLLSVAAVGTTLLMARALSGLAADASERSQLRTPSTMLFSWGTLCVASALAALWLPRTLAPLGELPLATQPHYLAAAFWPIVLGTLLASGTAALYRRGAGGGRGVMAALPAGDVVVPLERVAGGSVRLLSGINDARLRRRWSDAWDGLQREAGHAIDRMSRTLENLAAGPMVGVLLCLLAIALYFSLS